MNGCPFLVEDCTMDGTDYDCEHPTYGTKYGCDHCPMFGRHGKKRQYRLINPRSVKPPTREKHYSQLGTGSRSEGGALR